MGHQQSPRKPAESPWSVRLATIAGIPVRVHFTFLLFLAWLAYVGNVRKDSLWSALILAIFGCVLLHELGHALVARRYGIGTRDITLYPMGGVASIQSRPTPMQEFWISVAGPAVNVLIMAVLAAAIGIVYQRAPIGGLGLAGKPFVDALFTANAMLVLFNMIPAFPMDGGRVLRSLLALRMGEEPATRIATALGQFVAIAMGFAAVFTGSIILLIIAFFVFLGAAHEAAAVTSYTAVSGRTVADAMVTRFEVLEANATLAEASSLLLQGSQQEFPVLFGEEALGVLGRLDIVRGLSTEGPNGYVSQFMERDVHTMSPADSLEAALERFSSGSRTPILVREEGKLVGLLTLENLSEFMLLERAMQRREAGLRA